MKDQLQCWDRDDSTLQGNAKEDTEQELFICKESDFEQGVVTAHV